MKVTKNKGSHEKKNPVKGKKVYENNRSSMFIGFHLPSLDRTHMNISEMGNNTVFLPHIKLFILIKQFLLGHSGNLFKPI